MNYLCKIWEIQLSQLFQARLLAPANLFPPPPALSQLPASLQWWKWNWLPLPLLHFSPPPLVSPLLVSPPPPPLVSPPSPPPPLISPLSPPPPLISPPPLLSPSPPPPLYLSPPLPTQWWYAPHQRHESPQHQHFRMLYFQRLVTVYVLLTDECDMLYQSQSYHVPRSFLYFPQLYMDKSCANFKTCFNIQ